MATLTLRVRPRARSTLIALPTSIHRHPDPAHAAGVGWPRLDLDRLACRPVRRAYHQRARAAAGPTSATCCVSGSRTTNSEHDSNKTWRMGDASATTWRTPPSAHPPQLAQKSAASRPRARWRVTLPDGFLWPSAQSATGSMWPCVGSALARHVAGMFFHRMNTTALWPLTRSAGVLYAELASVPP